MASYYHSQPSGNYNLIMQNFFSYWGMISFKLIDLFQSVRHVFYVMVETDHVKEH